MPRESHAHATGGTVAPRWWRRALPLTALAVGVTAATVALAGGNAEVRASTTREVQPVLELGLLRAPEEVCGPQVARVKFTLVSHLEADQVLQVEVAAAPVKDGRATTRKREVWLQKDATTTVATRVKAPRGAYDVTVSVDGRPEALTVHCAAGGGAR